MADEQEQSVENAPEQQNIVSIGKVRQILANPVAVIAALWWWVPLGVVLILANKGLRRDYRWWAGVGAWVVVLFFAGRWSDPRPIYSSLEETYEAIIESSHTQFMKDNGITEETEIDKIPKAAQETALEQRKKDVDSLFAKRKPPKVTIEDDVAAKIKLLSVGAPVWNKDWQHHWDIPLKLLAKTSIKRYDTGIRYKAYAPDNTLLHEGAVYLNVNASPGETADGEVSSIEKTVFFRMHRLALVAE